MAQYQKMDDNSSVHSDKDAAQQKNCPDFLTNIFNQCQTFFEILGQTSCDNFKKIQSFVKNVKHGLKQRHGKKIRFFVKRRIRKIKYLLDFLKRMLALPFKKAARGIELLKDALLRTKAQPAGHRIKYFLNVLWDGLKNNRKIFSTVINYTLPVAGIFLFIYTINLTGSFTYAVHVSYNGEVLGYVENENIVNTASEIVQSRMVYLNENEHLQVEPEYSVAITNTKDVLTEYQLADEIIRLSGDEMIEAEGLYIDGKFYGALEEKGIIQEELDKILNEYKSESSDDKVSFVNHIEIIPGLYLTQNILPKEEVVTLLHSEKQSDVYYTIAEGDTPLGVADKNDVSYSTLKGLNPEIETNEFFRPGTQVLISNSEAFLPVQVQKTVSYSQSIAYETEVTESNKYAKGTEHVDREGENGESLVTANVTYINNIEVSREIITTEVVKEPVSKKVTKGTAVVSQNVSSSTGSGKISSGFIWPISGCYVSDVFGPRWGTLHGGLDLCRRGGTTGAPVMAVAGGTVVAAYTSGSWGKLVRVDHGNGLQTWYAHNSSLNVSVGDVVSQGQVIAYAGATGNVTGAHLHFEVRVNGIRKNPLNYLP